MNNTVTPPPLPTSSSTTNTTVIGGDNLPVYADSTPQAYVMCICYLVMMTMIFYVTIRLRFVKRVTQERVAIFVSFSLGFLFRSVWGILYVYSRHYPSILLQYRYIRPIGSWGDYFLMSGFIVLIYLLYKLVHFELHSGSSHRRFVVLLLLLIFLWAVAIGTNVAVIIRPIQSNYTIFLFSFAIIIVLLFILFGIYGSVLLYQLKKRNMKTKSNTTVRRLAMLVVVLSVIGVLFIFEQIFVGSLTFQNSFKDKEKNITNQSFQLAFEIVPMFMFIPILGPPELNPANWCPRNNRVRGISSTADIHVTTSNSAMATATTATQSSSSSSSSHHHV
eukprot:TRINITY_DN5298_c0_g1_i2.p1 TRINITY_DN5298_c0_g1~~TRINITY_DN5298_c0_g1_i2.p1  ORF type:complete len:333 (+),score=78.37 TRINITY_DN5298_c0_g1_i2:276-1274(+)